jgi:hypothetical protein
MQHFRIKDLPVEPFAPSYARPDRSLEKHGAMRRTAEGGLSYPCRTKLTDHAPLTGSSIVKPTDSVT